MDDLSKIPNDPAKGQVHPSLHVPPGFQLCFTAKGIPFLKKENEQEEEAENEFVREQLPITVSLDEIEKRFGIGTRLYFTFLKLIMLSNLVLAIFAAIHWITHLGKKTDGWATEDLFISSYSRDEYALWMAMNVISILLWFVFGPLYWLYLKKRLEAKHIEDHDNPYAFSGLGLDTIDANRHFTSSQRFWRRVASYILFAIMVAIAGGITYGLQVAGNEYGDPSQTINVYNFIVTFSVTFINFFFSQICSRLTNLEKHRTWSVYRKHEGFKLIAFKICNVTVFYAALQFAFNTDRGCVFRDSGSKFLSLQLTDLFILNFIEMVLPLSRLWAKRNIKALQSAGSDESDRPDFDVAQEYLELFYRQFIIYLGMGVFPMLTVLGLITNLVEYPLDKFRMLYICQKPKRLDLSMKKFLGIWLVVVALAGLLSWPQGAAYVLSATRGRGSAFSGCAILPD